MLQFFKYNWQVRDEWLKWCGQLLPEELTKVRVGGVGSILYTLFHIIDVEYSWIRGIQGKKDVVLQFEDYMTLEEITSLSELFRVEIADFLKTIPLYSLDERVRVPWSEEDYTINEIIHHIIAHEIHHVGQLSIWSRELDLAPVPANFIGRKLKSL